MFWLIVIIIGIFLASMIETNRKIKKDAERQKELEHQKIIERQKELERQRKLEWKRKLEHKREIARKNIIQQLLPQLKEIARQYSELENAVLKELNFSNLKVTSYYAVSHPSGSNAPELLHSFLSSAR